MEKEVYIRVAFVGNVDSGKSSLIGCLLKGELDDGRGLSRQAIFRHKHESDSGRTSSIATTYIGFDGSGDQILSKRPGRVLPWEEIAKTSERRVQLIDLAGHERYLKTTVFGLTGMAPDLAVVLVGANMGVKKMTREHLHIAIALEIPLVIALTKIDIAPKNIALDTLKSIRQLLKKAGKMPMLVKTEAQAAQAADSIRSNRVTPILPMSNVTGEGLANLKKLLALIPPRPARLDLDKQQQPEADINVDGKAGPIHSTEAPVEVPIDETYQVPGVGFVVSGVIASGTITVNDTLLLGPEHNGGFKPVTVRSIESMHVSLRQAKAGHTAAFAVRSLNKKEPISRTNFRKGMVLVGTDVPLSSFVTREFEARVHILHHQTTISKGYQPVINCSTVRQTAEIVSIQAPDGGDTIRTGDNALVRFRFVSYAEYLKPRTRFVFRDGQAKGIGKIVRIIPNISNSPRGECARSA